MQLVLLSILLALDLHVTQLIAKLSPVHVKQVTWQVEQTKLPCSKYPSKHTQ